jgi:hypothetical protein
MSSRKNRPNKKNEARLLAFLKKEKIDVHSHTGDRLVSAVRTKALPGKLDGRR